MFSSLVIRYAFLFKIVSAFCLPLFNFFFSQRFDSSDQVLNVGSPFRETQNIIQKKLGTDVFTKPFDGAMIILLNSFTYLFLVPCTFAVLLNSSLNAFGLYVL